MDTTTFLGMIYFVNSLVLVVLAQLPTIIHSPLVVVVHHHHHHPHFVGPHHHLQHDHHPCQNQGIVTCDTN